MGAEEGRAMALEREAEAEDEVRWEKLPSTPVRVLLVERDDSTRQIIAALLRKCGYGVAAASNGLKAWEILKEKVHDIDLVLTEVELPKISGVELLTMIMDHDMFRHISVIMMSSNDSISIVLKCMMKGAADFLVKPIRKNELTNLWQHVWRKNKIFLSGDTGHGFAEHQDEKRAIKKQKIVLENDCFSKEYANHELDSKECCEKESDAQSSCTRSDMELESTCTTRMMEHKRAQHEGLFLFSKTINWDKQVKEKMDNILPLSNGEINGVASLDSQAQPEVKFNGQELKQDKYSTEKLDLLEAINNQSQQNSCNGSSLANSEDNLFGAIDLNQKSSSMPSLELSLDIHRHTVLNKQENDESNVLRHSNSAFSLYNNNSRIVQALANPANFQAQKQGSMDSSIELSPDHSAANPVQPFGSILKPDDTKFTIASIPRLDEDTFQSASIRFIHFLVPVSGVPFNAIGSNPMLQPIFYPQPALASWSAMPSMMQEAFVENPSHQAGSTDYTSYKIQSFGEDNTKEEITEPVQEERRTSMAAAETTSVCNDKRYHRNPSEPAGIHIVDTKPVRTHNISEDSATSMHKVGCINGGTNSDVHCVSQRQAALAKFRSKRKDRCFAKKVRYLSRQKLAEQRPRLKGQFVRQA